MGGNPGEETLFSLLISFSCVTGVELSLSVYTVLWFSCTDLIGAVPVQVGFTVMPSLICCVQWCIYITERRRRRRRRKVAPRHDELENWCPNRTKA